MSFVPFPTARGYEGLEKPGSFPSSGRTADTGMTGDWETCNFTKGGIMSIS